MLPQSVSCMKESFAAPTLWNPLILIFSSFLSSVPGLYGRAILEMQSRLTRACAQRDDLHNIVAAGSKQPAKDIPELLRLPPNEMLKMKQKLVGAATGSRMILNDRAMMSRSLPAVCFSIFVQSNQQHRSRKILSFALISYKGSARAWEAPRPLRTPQHTILLPQNVWRNQCRCLSIHIISDKQL